MQRYLDVRVQADPAHKMPDCKVWLKGVYDGKLATQPLLVTGSARMDT